jgi:glucose uptake protein
MYQPQVYGAALALMILSMLCWGSWANTMKLTIGWPFQAFYWDYVGGIFLASLLWGVLFGGSSFLTRLLHADPSHLLLAVVGGIVFNVANLLIVAAIEIAGMAVAFPIGIGLALVVGAILNYVLVPVGNPLLLAGGVVLVLVAIGFDAIAYRRREASSSAVTANGIRLSLFGGLLMGLFYPFVAKSLVGPRSLDAYTVSVIFALGVAVCALPLNYFFMRRPLTATPRVAWKDYFSGKGRWHFAATLGGMIWCTGAEANFVASQAHLVGPATSYTIGQGATMVSALWGVCVWKEFAGAPTASRRLLLPMFGLFLLGLVCVALAPLY